MRRLPLGVAVVGTAALMRIVPLASRDALGATTQYDGGVYLGAAFRLVHGFVPYRDFVYVQPPGSALILTPLTALGSEHVALVAAKLLIIGLGALNAWLIYRVVRPAGELPAVLAGLLYAVWGVPVAAERTLLLEPFVTLAALVAFLLLHGGGRRRALGAGAVLGLAITLKLWAVVLLAVFLGWLLLTGRRRDGGFVLLTSGATALAVVATFFLLAPGQMWDQVVEVQAGRAREVSLVQRLEAFEGARGYVTDRVPSLLVVSGLGFVILAAAVLCWLRANARVWLALAAVQLAVVLASPSFYDHYPAFPAAALCIVVGFALAGLPGRPQIAMLFMAAVVTASLGYVNARQLEYNIPLDGPALRAFANSRTCVWSNWPDVLLAADQAVKRASAPCVHELDQFGVGLISQSRLERQRLREFERSDAAILVGTLHTMGWTPATERAFTTRFTPAGRAGPLTLWTAQLR